jgi:hypothetical protein
VQSPKCVIHEEDPGEAARLQRIGSSYVDRSPKPGEAGFGQFGPYCDWTLPNSRRMVGWPLATLAFMHGRRAAKGEERLVVVELHESLRSDEGAGASALVFYCQTCQLGTWKEPLFPIETSGLAILRSPPRDPDEDEAEMARQFIQIKRARVFAGQPDPKDQSHFTVAMEINGHSATLDGWLQTDDKVHLTIRERPPTLSASTVALDLRQGLGTSATKVSDVGARAMIGHHAPLQAAVIVVVIASSR